MPAPAGADDGNSGRLDQVEKQMKRYKRYMRLKAKTNVKRVEYMPLEVEGTPRDFHVLSRHRSKKRKVRT